MWVVMWMVWSSASWAQSAPCGGAWLDAVVPEEQLAESTAACVGDWVKLAYGAGWDGNIDFDPPATERGPSGVTVSQLQEAKRRFAKLRAGQDSLEVTRALEGIDHMLAQRVGFVDVIEGMFPASYETAMMAVLKGERLEESMLQPHPSMWFHAETYRRLRNGVFARHGRTFQDPALQRFFYGADAAARFAKLAPTMREDFKDEVLTETDRANLALIQPLEEAARAREALSPH